MCIMPVKKLIFFVWCGLLCAITGLLVAEYHFFKEHSTQLSRLKDEYSTYVLAFKKLIIEYNSLKESTTELADSTEQKKKPKSTR